jgi:hypothetical protein
MLQPHSFLWHYLWLGPCVLLAVLAFLTWRRGLHRLFPAFFVYMVFEAVQGLVLYALDIIPSVTPQTYWRASIVGLIIEGLVKFTVVWGLFATLIRNRPSVARLGIRLIACAVWTLAALALLAAAHAPVGHFAILSYFRILEQTIYFIQAGIMLFIFFFAAYFRLEWNRTSFGIALGLSLSSCVGLGVFAVCAGEVVFKGRYLLDILDMGTYHVCVLIWFHYLLWPPGREALGAISESVKMHPSPSSAAARGNRLLGEVVCWGGVCYEFRTTGGLGSPLHLDVEK